MTISKRLKDLSFESLEPISYYMKEFNSSFSMGKHTHSYIELMYCESGKFKFEVIEKDLEGKEITNTYIISKNEFVIIDAQTVHRLITDFETPVMIYNIEFAVRQSYEYNPFNVNSIMTFDLGSLIRNSGLNSIANNENGYFILKDTESVSHAARTLIIELNDGVNNLEKAVIVKSRFMLLLIEISKCRSTMTSNDGILYIKKAKDFIKQNYVSNISIDEIASYVEINKAYLQRLFKKYTVATILTVINNYRVSSCQQLLTTTNLSIEQIASKTGFQNRQHLIYEFKLHLNCSPSDYRKRYLAFQVDHQFKNYDSKWIKD